MGTAATHPECQPGLTSLNKMIIITLLWISGQAMNGRQARDWLLVVSQLWCQERWWWTEWEKQKRLQLLQCQWSLDTIVTLLSPSLLANYYPLMCCIHHDSHPMTLCSSPGLLASSPLPTFCCPLLSLFALIVNCHLIVSWYDQLPPSSCKHRLQVTTAIYNSITQYFSNQPPAAGVCMNKDRFELCQPRSLSVSVSHCQVVSCKLCPARAHTEMNNKL